MLYGSLPQAYSSSVTSMIGVTATATLWRSVGMRRTSLSLLRRLTRAPCTLHRLVVSLLLPLPRRSSQRFWAFSPKGPALCEYLHKYLWPPTLEPNTSWSERHYWSPPLSASVNIPITTHHRLSIGVMAIPDVV